MNSEGCCVVLGKIRISVGFEVRVLGLLTTEIVDIPLTHHQRIWSI